MNKTNVIKIGISTCKKYVNKTTPLLISSLTKSGIDKKDIYVFCGDCSENKNYIRDDINCYAATHNSFDYTSYIEIIENKLDYNWFLMHDTCKVGPKFKELLYSKTELNRPKIALKTWPPTSMSIGYFRYDYLNKYRDKILSFKNLDKVAAVDNEDYFLTKVEPEICSYYGTERYEQPLDNSWYQTSTPRIQEYFPHLDLYKLKANWGQAVTVSDYVSAI